MNKLKNAPIVRVYAGALWKQISQSSKSKQGAFVKGAEALAGFLRENSEIFAYLCSVLVGRERRLQIFSNLCKEYGLPDLVLEFVGFLSDNRRLELLPEVLRLCLRNSRVERGLIGIYVFSSVPLLKKQKVLIENFLESKLQRKIVILSEEKLISGYGILLKTEFGGVFDWTTHSLINKLRTKWLEEFPLPI